MLIEVFAALDNWAKEKSRSNFDEGLPPLGKCLIQVVGQSALIEAKLDVNLAATRDVDVHQQLEYVFRMKFDELLKAKGKLLDPVGHEAWMPQETKYRIIYQGRHVEGSIAEPEYVLISKALKAPQKNKNLIGEYLAGKPSSLFHSLAKKYKVPLEDFLK